ncbi:MAG: hypothetical protein ABFD75_12460 [Smithella sp.]
MGKAKIISGGDKGLYSIELIEHTTRITADIAKINVRLPLLETTISDALIDKTTAEADYNAKKAAMDTIIGQYSLGQAKKTEVESAQSACLAAMKALQEKYFTYSLLLQEKESKTKQKALLEAIPLAHTVEGVWCADLTEDLEAGAEVGTIEPNGEPDDDIIIYPGGSADPFKHQFQPAMASTSAGYFLNMARFPGWQRWKPTYRIGTITALYSGEDYCDVALDAALSSVQDLNINPSSSTLVRVPVTYLTCNARAFTVGDRVVVQFTGQNWTTPKVIGFESNPKPCEEYVIFTITLYKNLLDGGGEYEKQVAVAWNPTTGEVVYGPVDTDDENYAEWYETKNMVESEKDLLSQIGIYGTMVTAGYTSDYLFVIERLLDGTYIVAMPIYEGSSASNWPAEELTDTAYDDTVIYDLWGIGKLNSIAHYGYELGAIYTGYVTVGGQSYQLPISPNSVAYSSALDGSKTGLRVSRTSEGNSTGFDTWGPLNLTVEQTDDYISPFGSMGTFNLTFTQNKFAVDMTNEYDAVGIVRELTFIPNWYEQGYTAGIAIPHQGAGNSFRWILPHVATADDCHAFNNIWFDSKVNSKYSDESIASIFLVQFVECTGHSEQHNTTTIDNSYAFASERTVFVHAQAISPEGGSSGCDWISEGRTAELETKIKEALSMVYSLNGIPDDEIRRCYIDIEIMR